MTFSSNRHPASHFLFEHDLRANAFSRLSAKGKPVPTHRVVARGHAFPDHALKARKANRRAARLTRFWLPTKNIENNPMQGSRQSPAWMKNNLTRRANQRHSCIIAQSAKRPWPRNSAVS